MYRVIAIYQRNNHKWERTRSKPFIMKEEADKEHEKQAFIARELIARNEILFYQIETIETFQKY